MNLLNIGADVDLTPILTAPVNTLARLIGVSPSVLFELLDLVNSYNSWSAEYDSVINGALERVTPSTLQTIKRAQILLDQVGASVSKAFYNSQDPDILALSELITDISDSVSQLNIRAAVAGAEIGVDGAPVAAAITYRVNQGDTLEGIAVRILGDSEAWVKVARFNDIDLATVGAITPLNSWVGRVLQLPTTGTSVRAERDPAVLDAPVGLRALGTNFPLTLASRSRNDVSAPGNVEFDVLNYSNAVLESLQTRLETAIGTLPDFPEYGSYVFTLLGQDHGVMSDRLLATHVETVLKSDPRVADVLNATIDKSDSAITINFQVRLFNGLTTSDLWLGYTLPRT